MSPREVVREFVMAEPPRLLRSRLCHIEELSSSQPRYALRSRGGRSLAVRGGATLMLVDTAPTDYERELIEAVEAVLMGDEDLEGALGILHYAASPDTILEEAARLWGPSRARRQRPTSATGLLYGPRRRDP